MNKTELMPVELTNKTIESMIYEIRGQKVMLDFELAKIYGYETKRFNEQVKNNVNKFPERYRFQLTELEVKQISRSKKSASMKIMQTEGMKGGRTSLPWAFTEQGIYMLMTVLNGDLATKQSIALIDTFKSMKDYIIENQPILNISNILELSNTVRNNSLKIESIENKLNIVMDNFIDESTYKHFIILNGEKIESDVAYQNIYKKAKSSIIIIDDYIDIKTLQLLKASMIGVDIVIITDNKARNGLTANFINDSDLVISFKKNNGKFHDRYIILDYKTKNERFYHCGASSKDSGKKITAINKLEDENRYYQSVDDALNSKDYIIN